MNKVLCFLQRNQPGPWFLQDLGHMLKFMVFKYCGRAKTLWASMGTIQKVFYYFEKGQDAFCLYLVGKQYKTKSTIKITWDVARQLGYSSKCKAKIIQNMYSEGYRD